ncbi:hypothetical protein G4B88_014525 [Cannabis sativa]|uniref:Uncharacterized protein n=1 Tax=Cannabis sativa TaxID=3483 RepID=A0A7J6IAN6_CANSA|nr:hypothetical protein G4B88_014525 [Cannabis sativa]
MPKILALMAVQRQIAAWRLAKPPISVQQGVLDGSPIITRCNRFAHTPNLRVSKGHLALELGGGGGVV